MTDYLNGEEGFFYEERATTPAEDVRTICRKILQGAQNNETVVLTPHDCLLLQEWATEILSLPLPYNSKFGDDKVCECGHKYYRHFDTYENMYPVGCKYCACDTFKEHV